jgi:hypothetical protein
MSDLFDAILENRQKHRDYLKRRKEKEFGTEPHKLVRRYDPATSIEAASKIDSTRLEKLVLETIESFGARGCISDEVQANLSDLPYSSVTARYKALFDRGYIFFNGEKRKGRSTRPQRVMIASTYDERQINAEQEN